MNGMRERLKAIAYWMAVLLPLATPLYLIRFRIGLLPTTLLEIYLVAWLGLWLMAYGLSGIRAAWNRIGEWRWPAMAWMIASLASVFWSPSIVTGLGLWRAYVLEPVVAFVLLAAMIVTGKDKRRLEGAVYILVAITVFWAMAQYVTGLGIPSPWNVAIDAGRRATGPFPYPNALALLIVPVGAYAFMRFLEQKREWFLLGVWLLAGIGAFLAKSDGGLLALACATWLVLVVGKESRRLAIVLALLGALLIVLVAPLRNAFIEQATFSGWSGRVRTWMWTETWNMLNDRPVLGAGFGGYPIVFKPYHEKTFIEIFQYPHNIVLNFWSETGLVGLIVFGWIVVIWVRSAYRVSPGGDVRQRYASCVMRCAPLIAILVHGLVDVPYFKNDLAIVFWLLVFLTTAKLDQKLVNR